MKPNTPAFLRSWADEIASRANRVRYLIGSAHWLSDGTYKEYVVRSLLGRHLPAFLATSSGFVRDLSKAAACSRQIDILISNPAQHVPLLSEGDLQIVVPSAVLATIEVKSTYSTGALRDAITNAQSVTQTISESGIVKEIWTSIVFGTPDAGFTIDRLADSVVKIVEESFQDSGNGPSRDNIQLPQCIAVHDGGLAMVSYTDSGEVSVRAFKCPELALSLAIAQVLAHVQAQLAAENHPGELDYLLRNFSPDSEMTERRFKTNWR